MNQEKNKEESENDDENEVAIALVAECEVDGKKYKAGDTWPEEADECRMNICNPGGIISHLECPRFDTGDEDSCVRIPGDNKYAYPHCCDYVFRAKKKEEEENPSATAAPTAS